MADLHEEWNTLVDIQRLIICVMVSIIVGNGDMPVLLDLTAALVLSDSV